MEISFELPSTFVKNPSWTGSLSSEKCTPAGMETLPLVFAVDSMGVDSSWLCVVDPMLVVSK